MSRQRRERDRPLVAWRFSDGKRGHDNQSLGLLEALAERAPLEIHTFGASVGRAAAILAGRPGALAPPPALCVGAGHATHLPLLAARLKHGAFAVVLMKPSLPRRLFDLCLVPEHDGVAPGPGVMVTRGALNRVRPGRVQADPGRGLIALGGPSRHHAWDDAGVVEQVTRIAERAPEIAWSITTSRRTPASTLAALRQARLDTVALRPFESVSPDWLAAELPRCGAAWVSEDSVSMVFEALTAGAATGLIEVPPARLLGRRRRGRVARSVDRLAAEGRVVRHSDWLAGRSARRAGGTFDEAGRCAIRLAELLG